MGFLAPWFLAGLAALGLPVYLHLLRRSQQTPRPVSSIMFFERRLETTSKQRRLRYLALLAARLALLALLAFGFSSPFINRRSDSQNRQTLVVIALDRSFSMRASDRFSKAKAAAHSVVQTLPGRQMAQVVAFDNRVENMTTPEYAHGSLDAAIDAVQPTDLDSSFGELVRSLKSLAQNKDRTVEAHLFSDMQQTSTPADFRDLSLGDAVSLELHRVGAAIPNWTVETVVTAPHVYDVKRTVLSATITGFETPAASQRAELLIDDKPVDSRQLNVPANGRAPLEFRGFNVPYGQHRGEVRIASNDNLSQDNRFFFSVERTDPRKVLFLYARGRDKQSYYYRAAFESAPDLGLQVDTAPVEQVANRDLSGYAFIVLHDPENLDKAIEQKLCGYVMSGGSALVAIGHGAIYSGRIPLSKLSLTGSADPQGVGFLDSANAALRDAGHFENVEFTQTGRWKPAANDHVLARLADGSPLLVEEPMGEGRVLQFASTLDGSANNFPLHSSYLPFVAQTARYLAGNEEWNASYVAGSSISLRKTKATQKTAEVTGPDGKHELSLAASKANSSFALDREGFYEITRADGRRQLIAAHADRRESDLQTLPDETLELWRNTGSTAARKQVATAATSETATQPWSFWRYLLILAVAAGLIEAALARRYVKEAQQTT